MAYDIGPKIGIEGEAEFRKAIQGVNTTLKTLGTEMSAVVSAYDKGDKSVEALGAQNDVLNKQITAQKEKLEQLKSGLSASAEKYGENDRVTQGWQQAVNKATADLNNMERQVKDNTTAMSKEADGAKEAGDKTAEAGKKAKQSGDDAEKGEGKWSKFGAGLGKVGAAAGKAVAGLGAAAAGAAAAVGGMAVKAAYAADDINTLAAQTGLAVEDIQKFQYASEVIDVPLETLTKSMARLTKNMEAARIGSKNQSEAFRQLGVSVLDSNGELRNNQDVLADVLAAMDGMENATQRDALAMQLFGRSAQDLNPLLHGGADALKELGDQADRAGLILGQDSLDELNKLSDAMDIFKATLPAMGNLFSVALTGPMSEGLNFVTDALHSLTGAFKEGGLEGLFSKLGDVIGNIVSKITEKIPEMLKLGLDIVKGIARGIAKNMPAIAQAAIEVVKMLIETLIELLPEILKMGIEVVVALAEGLAGALPELIPAVVSLIMTMYQTLIANLPMLLDAAILLIGALAEGLIDAIPVLIEALPALILGIVDFLTSSGPELIKLGVKLVYELSRGIIISIPAIIKAVIELFAGLVKMSLDSIKGFVDIGKNIVKGVWEGIAAMARWIKDKVSDFFGGIVSGVKGFLGIKSPSKVFAGIGSNMAAGLGDGFASKMRSVAKQINGAVPTDITMSGQYQATANLGEGIVNGLRGALGNTGAQTINLIVDGKTLAQVIFDPIRGVARQRGVALG